MDCLRSWQIRADIQAHSIVVRDALSGLGRLHPRAAFDKFDADGGGTLDGDKLTDGLTEVLGRAVTGHLIHGLELIAFHRRGFGINVLLTDSTGVPIGWN